MEELRDGIYEVVVVDASDGPDDVVHLEVVLVSGPDKGMVLPVQARQLARDATDLLGLPATLEVAAGAPSLRFD